MFRSATIRGSFAKPVLVSNHHYLVNSMKKYRSTKKYSFISDCAACAMTLLAMVIKRNQTLAVLKVLLCLNVVLTPM